MAIVLTNIPRIMRGNRMPIGAKVMESWFSRPRATAPHYGTPDTTTVTLNWALGFARAKSVYDDIINNKAWVNKAAQRVIEKKLRAKSLVGSAPQNFGNLNKSPIQMETDDDQINQRAVGMSDMTQTLDDMDAALANFVFQVVVAGTVSPKGAIHQVDIKEVGIYIRDSYDFEGFQYLGTWDDTANTVSRSPIASGDTVWNSTFRDWRTANGMGGDYMIYSDVTKITLSPPDSFTIPVPPDPVKVPREYGPKW
jgi:hypothetical protein